MFVVTCTNAWAKMAWPFWQYDSDNALLAFRKLHASTKYDVCLYHDILIVDYHILLQSITYCNIILLHTLYYVLYYISLLSYYPSVSSPHMFLNFRCWSLPWDFHPSNGTSRPCNASFTCAARIATALIRSGFTGRSGIHMKKPMEKATINRATAVHVFRIFSAFSAKPSRQTRWTDSLRWSYVRRSWDVC